MVEEPKEGMDLPTEDEVRDAPPEESQGEVAVEEERGSEEGQATEAEDATAEESGQSSSSLEQLQAALEKISQQKNIELMEKEGLRVNGVFNKVNLAYIHVWTKEANGLFTQLVRWKKRRLEMQEDAEKDAVA